MNVVCRYLACVLINGSMLCNSAAIGAEPFDLAELENRLRDTEAIGLFSKISLKAQVDDLIDEFSAFHEGSGEDIESLRHRYGQLLSETLALLETGDPELRHDISQSRAVLWATLIDPVKFDGL